MRKIALSLLILCFAATLVGCGETMRGIGTDMQRIGKGTKTIFIRDDARE